MSDGSFNAGSARLHIRPELARDFNQKLRNELKRVNVTHDVKITPDLTGFKSKLAAAVKSAKHEVKVNVTPDLSGFQAKLNTAVKGVNSPTVKVKLAPDLSGFQAKLDTAVKGVNAPKIAVGAKVGDLTKFKTELNEKLDKINRKVTVGAKVGSLTQFRAELRAKLDGLGATVKVDAKLGSTASVRTDLRDKLKTVGGTVKVKPDLDFTQANAQLQAWRAAQGAIPLTLNVNVDTAAAVAQLMALRTLAGSIDLGSVGAGGGRSGSRGSGNQGGMIRRIRVQMEVDRASVARAQSEVAQAASKMQQAQRAQGDAADRVRLAQERLNEVNTRANATASQRLAASQALARAQRDLADRNGDVVRSTMRQSDAHRRLRQAQNDQNSISRLVRAGLTGLAESAMNAANNLGSMVNPAGLVMGALAGLAAVSLVPLIGQLTQAAGVLALLPAMGAAAGASLAAIVIGGNGIMDAFKAAGDAAGDTGKAADQAAKQQKNAAKQVEDAQRGVEDAYENAAWTAKDGARQIASAERQVQDAQKRSKTAQEDLTRARKDALEQIEDLNLALKGSAIDEEDALIAVERARERLRNLGRGGEPVTALDVREAQNNLRGAIQRVDEVRERNADLRKETLEANKAGVEGSQQVVAAKEAVADATQAEKDAQENLAYTHEQVARSNAQAQRQIEDALRRVAEAQEAQAESLTTASGSVDKFAEAMAKLSPNAQDFITKVRDLGGAWSDLRRQIQDNLFAGLGASIQDLAYNYFPVLREGLGGIATEINGGLKRVIGELNDESTRFTWATIFENTRLAIGPLMDGISSLVGAFTNIASVGSDFLADGAQSFADTMQRFEDWTGSPEGQESIRNFIDKSLEALGKVKDLFVEVGRVVGGIFSTSEENGKSMMDSITETLRGWADWLGTPEGQERMKQFWDDAQQTAADMLRLVGEAIKLADKVSKIVDTKFGLTTGNQGLVDENGNAVDKDGNRVIGRNSFFPGIEADSWLGRLLGGGDDGGDSVPPPEEGGIPSLGGKPFSGDLQSELQNQINAGNTEGGSFLGNLGDPEVWGEKWNNFSNTVSTGWNEKVWPSLQGVKDKAVEIGGGFVDDIQTKAGNAWTGLKDNVNTGWTSIQGTWNTLRTEGLGGLANDFSSKITNGAVTSWKDLPSHISSGVGDIINTHFPGLSNGLTTLQGWFQTGVDAIGRLWDGLKQKLSTPINFVIREVYNNGIKKFWDSIGPKVGLPELPVVNEIPAFATGGTVDGVMSGYSPGVDDRIIAVGGGEAVMRPEWTRAVGKDFVDQANHIARNQGVSGVKKFMGGFSNGGVVESIVKLVNENFPMMDITSTQRTTNDLHGQGKAVDFSNGYDTTPEMQDAARFFHDNYGSRLAELIHYPLNGWQNIDEGKPFNFGEPTNSQHRNHVHVAAHEPLVPMSEEEKGFFASIAGAVGGAISRVSSVFRNMAADLFEKPLNGLGALIPDQFEGIGEFGKIPKALYNTMKDKLIGFVRGKATEKDGSSGGNTPFDISGGAEQWRDTVLKALEMTGHDPSEADIVLKQIQIESGGNPNAINDWDINAQNGTPSKGLIQTIDPTFQAHRDPSLPNDPYDPLANIVAGIRYADATYGDIKNIWPKTMGYDAGGILPDDAMAFNTSGKPEAVFTHDEWKMLQHFADLVGRPDFIDQLKAITGGPEEMPKDPALTTGNYGTGEGTAAAAGYTIPGEGVSEGLKAFDQLHGTQGAGGAGTQVDPVKHAQSVFTSSVSNYGQSLPGIAKTFLSGWIPEELINPGGLVGGLMSAGEELFNWYRNQATGGGAGAPAGGFDPGTIVSGFLGGGVPQPQPLPNSYQAAPAAVDQFVRNAPAPAQSSGTGAGGDEFHFHVTNIEEAFRKFQTMQAQKAAGFIRR